MEDMLQRITFDRQVLPGKPVIRGLRISVEMILDLLAKGSTRQEILEDYPILEPEDIQAALTYAQHLEFPDTKIFSLSGNWELPASSDI